MKEMQDKIVKLLEGYTFREKKIALLRHEWYHPNQVTPEEMLEAMAYSRNTDGGAPGLRAYLGQDLSYRFEL